MKSKEKGDVCVGQAIAYYLSKQCEVLLPVGDKQKYDIVVDEAGALKKVQCKYTSHIPDGYYIAPLRVMGGNQTYYSSRRYRQEDFDILFVMTAEGAIYEIPHGFVAGNKCSISLGPKYEQFKVKSGG